MATRTVQLLAMITAFVVTWRVLNHRVFQTARFRVTAGTVGSFSMLVGFYAGLACGARPAEALVTLIGGAIVGTSYAVFRGAKPATKET